MITLENLFKFQVEHNISDIHLVTNEKPLLRSETREIVSFNDTIVTPKIISNFVKELCNEKELEYFNKNGNLDKAISFKDIGRFRIAIFTERRGTGMVFRYIKQELMNIEDLWIDQKIRNEILWRSWLLLVSGPNNSGKSTLINAFVNDINKKKNVKIITFEDPIEYIHENDQSLITQHEISKNNKKQLKEDLKSVFRQDANIVVIWEIRDADMMNIALEMCESGYLVIGTIHGTDTVQTLWRMSNMFEHDSKTQLYKQLAKQLKFIICQHLLPGTDNEATPCREILINNYATSNSIATGNLNDIYQILETGQNDGNVLFDHALVDLYTDKAIEIEIVYEYCNNPDLTRELINK